MSKTVTNKNQFERLVRLMEQNPEIAKGLAAKVDMAKKWELFSKELNSLGPPLRTADKWAKVWKDLKFNTKKRKMQNKAEFRATGGGPNKLYIFSALEEVVVGLLELDTCVDPPGIEIGGLEEPSENVSPVEHEEPTTSGMQTQNNVRTTEGRRNKTSGAKSNDKRIALLEEQCEIQKKYYKRISESMHRIAKSVESTAEYSKKTYQLKKEKLEIVKEEIKNKKQHRLSKLRLKKDILQLQKDNVNNILL